MKELLGISDFAAEAVFIDPKVKQKEKTDESIAGFAKVLEIIKL